MEAAGFELHFLIRETDCDHVVRDMRGVLPMMRNRRLRQFRGRCAMRISNRPKRGVAHRSRVKFQPGLPAKFSNVVKAETHDEIVRMLSVDDGLPKGGFAGLE